MMKSPNPLSKEFFQSKISSLKSELGDAKLLAVTKHAEFDVIEKLYHAGQKDFGENRIEALESKAKLALELGLNIKWHFIGKIQSNKVKRLLRISGLVALHSVDRISIAKSLIENSKEVEHGNKIDLFFQVNTSGESEKSGVTSEAELVELISLFDQAKSFNVCGLMTMATIRTDDKEKSARECFSVLAGLRDELLEKNKISLKLCMGMSRDYQFAVALGANWVRIGSLLFQY